MSDQMRGVRISDQEWAAIRRHARAKGITPSEWIRRVARRAVRDELLLLQMERERAA